MRRTYLLVLIETKQPEAQGNHACVGEERDGLVGAAQAGRSVALFPSGQGICHAVDDAVRAERVGSHRDSYTIWMAVLGVDIEDLTECRRLDLSVRNAGAGGDGRQESSSAKGSGYK